MDFIERAAQAVLPSSDTSMLVITTAVTTASLYAILNRVIHPRRPTVLPSPLSTHISRLSTEEQSQLLYPPDYFPGARDVPTPYGSVRCCTYNAPLPPEILFAPGPFGNYDEVLIFSDEFGPASGRKVLLVHGISTSCSK